jgi:hypothetical protein
MNGSLIQVLERKPWEKRAWMEAKSTFLAQNALPSPTLVPGSPNDDGPGLPTAVFAANISVERLVIRWMSVKSGLGIIRGGPAGQNKEKDRVGRMPEILKQLSGPEVSGTEDFPPLFCLKFTDPEFAKFLADPATTVRNLGHHVDNLTVSVSNSAWMLKERKWIKPSKLSTAQLPPAHNWVWWCGYQDEMCVCYRVLGG